MKPLPEEAGVVAERVTDMIYIKVRNINGIELLPLPEETPFWNGSDFEMTKKERRNYDVYDAIRNVENYYQVNSPTAFGDPDYSRVSGYLNGLLRGYGLDMQRTDDKIIIRTSYSGTKLMIIERPHKPDSYHKDKNEIRKLMDDIS